MPGLSVAENVFLGPLTPSRFGIVDRRRARRRGTPAVRGHRPRHRRDARTSERLSPVEPDDDRARARARARVARCSSSTSRPPRSPMPRPASCSAVIERLRDRGVGVLYVSHRLDEVFRIASRYTVLRNGRRVADGPMAGTTVEAVIGAMAGRPIDAVFPPWHRPGTTRCCASRASGAGVIRDVTLDAAARRGAGHRRARGLGSQRAAAAHGRRVPRPWRVDDASTGGRTAAQPGAAQRAGVVLVPAGATLAGAAARLRRAQPQCDDHRTPRATAGRRLASPRAGPCARDLWDRFDVRGHGLDQEVLTLSGGNQQKVVLARFLALRPRVLLLDEPTRGVDVATRERDLPTHPGAGRRRAAPCSWSAPSCRSCWACATGSWCSTRDASRHASSATRPTRRTLLHACYGRVAA